MAQRLLQEAGIHGQLALGAMIDPPGEEAERSLVAHAWVRCGSYFITGEAGHERYAVVSTFHW